MKEKVLRHPILSRDFNVKGIRYKITQDGKLIVSYMGDGKKKRFIPLPKGYSLLAPFKIEEEK